MIRYFIETLITAFSGHDAAQASVHVGIVFIIFFALIGFWIFKANIVERVKTADG
jgi:uncharacterized membrane protein